MALKLVQSPLSMPPYYHYRRPPFVRHITPPHIVSRTLSIKHVASSLHHDSRMSQIKQFTPAALQTSDRIATAYITSDVKTEKPIRPFWEREWLPNDIFRFVLFVGIHLVCLSAPFYFTWPAFWLGFALYIVTGLFGITLSYHRNLTHRSFNLPKWLEYTCAYCGVLAGQGNPLDWVSTHRYHHQFTDTSKDPHSPNEGFWFSHMKWIVDRTYLTKKCGEPDNVSDLRKQPFYRFIESTYYLHLLASSIALFAAGGIPFFVWGGAMRAVFVIHITFMVNSVCHIWGERVWNTSDLSKNNWWVALLSFGEGWHNNHHAFEYSARQGFEWWQIDMTWGVIRMLEALGLATDVKLPTEQQKKRMALKNSIVAR
uniref:Fatty acid desaturase domain-containing protein n=1 Tax=Kalanchoe fedtschenkoi TaxID=63787 RepID=A0A7N0V926_KALFE